LFTRACPWSLSWARWIKSTPSHFFFLSLFKIHLNSILTSMSRTPVWPFYFRFSDKIFLHTGVQKVNSYWLLTAKKTELFTLCVLPIIMNLLLIS
jgi:hypothetical protein